MRWVLLTAGLALATAGCGGGSTQSQGVSPPGTMPAGEHLVALGTPWKNGFPI
jgi:hypothetical protein